MSHLCSYSSHHSLLHPSSLCFFSTTLASLQSTKSCHLSQSPHVIIPIWHWLCHTLTKAFPWAYLFSFQCHVFLLIQDSMLSLGCDSVHDQPRTTSSPSVLKGLVTWSHSHRRNLTEWWQVIGIPVPRPSTASKYLSKLAWSGHQSRHNHDLVVNLYACSIGVPNLAQFQPPNSHNYGLQAYLYCLP
jgi:hypothetical protein